MTMAVWGHLTGAARLATAALRGPLPVACGVSAPPILSPLGGIFRLPLLRLGAPLRSSAISDLLGGYGDSLLPVCYCSLPINAKASVASYSNLRHFSTQQKEPGEAREAFEESLRSAGGPQGPPPVSTQSPGPPSSVPAGGPRRPPEEQGQGLASDDAVYQAAADSLLEGLGEQLQEASGIEEVDFRDGVLKILCAGGVTLVLNKHYVTRQIWYASPLSGAQYFEFSLGWVCARTGTSLLEALRKDLDKSGSQPPPLSWPDGSKP